MGKGEWEQLSHGQPHTCKLKQLWTPAQPRTGSCGSAQHMAPSMAEKTHFPLSTACFVAQGCCGTVLAHKSQTPWELSNLLPLLTNCWNKLVSYRCCHLHSTLWPFSPDKIRSTPASSSSRALGQHNFESRTSCSSPQKFSLAQHCTGR